MPKGIPLTEEEQQRRQKQIFNASVHLFLEKGFNETSMREIANAANVGKSTLYDYFPTKEDILVTYFLAEIQKITESAQKIVCQKSPVAERFRSVMRMHLDYLLVNKNSFLKLGQEAQRLSSQSQKKIQTARYDYQDMIRELIEEGIQKGEFRHLNSLFAARSSIMLLSNAVFTSRPTGTPEDMLEEAMAIFFTGVLR